VFLRAEILSMPSKPLSVRLPLWLVLYFILWTVLPFALSTSYPLDVPEGIYWGREWQWGYYKHPPLSSWILYSFYYIFGHIGPYILSQCTIALSLWLAYQLGRQLMSRSRAFLGALFLLAIFYYTWPSLEFNHNIAQMPVWLGLVYIFYLATRQNCWRYWLLFGLLAGAGMLVKYTVALLIITMILYSVCTPYRRLWLTAKPWLAILIALLVFAPNIYWLMQHNWLPLTYASARSAEDASRNGHLAALGYLGTQIINHLPLLLILLFTRTRLSLRTPIQILLHKSDWRFLLWMGLAPTLILSCAGLIFGLGLRDMWGMPMWGLSGLIIVALIPEQVFADKSTSLLKAIVIWVSIVTILMVTYVEFGARIRHKPSRMDWPQTELASQADEQWQTLSSCKLDSVTGSDWVVLLVASYSNFAPSVMVSGDAAYSPWMSSRRLQEHGTLALWPDNEQPKVPWLQPLAQRPDLVMKQGEWTIAWGKLPDREPLKIRWQAYIPKRCLK
jgi:4-amino-4-deoxy-L-arabinose transferase-like glycosyltransferase